MGDRHLARVHGGCEAGGSVATARVPTLPAISESLEASEEAFVPTTSSSASRSACSRIGPTGLVTLSSCSRGARACPTTSSRDWMRRVCASGKVRVAARATASVMREPTVKMRQMGGEPSFGSASLAGARATRPLTPRRRPAASGGANDGGRRPAECEQWQ